VVGTQDGNFPVYSSKVGEGETKEGREEEWGAEEEGEEEEGGGEGQVFL
jgi:hypothetical protein